jgi:hypothetical protein
MKDTIQKLDGSTNLNCNICDSEFDLEGEGGTNGYFGITPVSFCPWCLSCMIDMVQHMTGEGEIDV